MTTIYDINNVLVQGYGRDDSEVIDVILSMIATSYCLDEQTFKYLLQLLNNRDYNMLVGLRGNNSKCGYPLCSRSITISDRANCASLYCNDLHFDSSQFIFTQLKSRPRIDMQCLFDDNGNIVSSTPKVTLFEELLRDKTTENDLDSLTVGMNHYHLK